MYCNILQYMLYIYSFPSFFQEDHIQKFLNHCPHCENSHTFNAARIITLLNFTFFFFLSSKNVNSNVFPEAIRYMNLTLNLCETPPQLFKAHKSKEEASNSRVDVKGFRKVIHCLLLPFRGGISFLGRMLGGQTFVLFPPQPKEHITGDKSNSSSEIYLTHELILALQLFVSMLAQSTVLPSLLLLSSSGLVLQI